MAGEHNVSIVEEMRAAQAVGIHPPYYILARLGDATGQEIVAAAIAGLSILDYGSARMVGASHQDALAAYAAGTLVDYNLIRRSGANHADAQVLAALGSALDAPAT